MASQTKTSIHSEHITVSESVAERTQIEATSEYSRGLVEHSIEQDTSQIDNRTALFQWLDVDAEAVRNANRKICEKATDEELRELHEERSALVDKKYDEGLDPVEERRLSVIRWEIEAIEDARHGQGIDRLEKLSRIQRGLGNDIEKLVNEIHRYNSYQSRKWRKTK
jgi:hypothetical protein